MAYNRLLTLNQNLMKEREGGGTPNIIGAIRAGLAFQVKEKARSNMDIKQIEEDFLHRALERWSRNPNISILGNPQTERLPIVSFVIKHGQQLLHHGFG